MAVYVLTMPIEELRQKWREHLDACAECERLPDRWCDEGTLILSDLTYGEKRETGADPVDTVTAELYRKEQK